MLLILVKKFLNNIKEDFIFWNKQQNIRMILWINAIAFIFILWPMSLLHITLYVVMKNLLLLSIIFALITLLIKVIKDRGELIGNFLYGLRIIQITCYVSLSIPIFYFSVNATERYPPGTAIILMLFTLIYLTNFLWFKKLKNGIILYDIVVLCVVSIATFSIYNTYITKITFHDNHELIIQPNEVKYVTFDFQKIKNVEYFTVPETSDIIIYQLQKKHSLEIHINAKMRSFTKKSNDQMKVFIEIITTKLVENLLLKFPEITTKKDIQKVYQEEFPFLIIDVIYIKNSSFNIESNIF